MRVLRSRDGGDGRGSGAGRPAGAASAVLGPGAAAADHRRDADRATRQHEELQAPGLRQQSARPRGARQRGGSDGRPRRRRGRAPRERSRPLHGPAAAAGRGAQRVLRPHVHAARPRDDLGGQWAAAPRLGHEDGRGLGGVPLGLLDLRQPGVRHGRAEARHRHRRRRRGHLCRDGGAAPPRGPAGVWLPRPRQPRVRAVSGAAGASCGRGRARVRGAADAPGQPRGAGGGVRLRGQRGLRRAGGSGGARQARLPPAAHEDAGQAPGQARRAAGGVRGACQPLPGRGRGQ